MTGADRFMREDFAPLDLCQTFFDFADEPLVVIDDPFDRVACHVFGVAAPLVRNARKLGSQIWRQVHFHLVSVQEDLPPQSSRNSRS